MQTRLSLPIALLYLLALIWPVLMGVPTWASNITGADFFGLGYLALLAALAVIYMGFKLWGLRTT
jgi:hypothetical protein